MTDSQRHLFETANELEQKFDFGLVALGFSALALSIQFSPRMGHELPNLLIASWAFYLSSGLFGGWRLMHKPVAFRYNLRRNKYLDEIETFDSPAYRLEVEMGRARTQRSEPISEADLERLLKQRREWVKHAERNMDNYNIKFVRTLRIQVWLLILGLLTNGVFAGVNFLRDVEKARSSAVDQASHEAEYTEGIAGEARA